MFKVKGLKIRFERSTCIVTLPKLGMVKRDTIGCSIRGEEQGRNTNDLTLGIAILNPIDSYDKVTGKKIALTKALSRVGSRFTKVERTEIWEAFWRWVASWKKTEPCPACEVLPKLCEEINNEENEKEKTR